MAFVHLTTDSSHTPSSNNGITFKRMQIMQMGKCKIKAPQPQSTQSNLSQPQSSQAYKNKSFTVSLQKKTNS